ncbi:MAG: response regulator, partial [Bacteroidota bacterium]|nr:response regulator [Bacteroidota bacterium]
RKTGYECLSEIKLNNKLQQLPVIIYSTSLNQEVANLLYEKGASHYIRKPGDFSKLKKVILEALTTTYRNDSGTRSKQTFIIEA